MNISMLDILFFIPDQTLHQNDNEQNLDLRDRKLYLRSKQHCSTNKNTGYLQYNTQMIISHGTFIHNVHINQTGQSLRTDAIRFEYITFLLHSFDQNTNNVFLVIEQHEFVENRICMPFDAFFWNEKQTQLSLFLLL